MVQSTEESSDKGEWEKYECDPTQAPHWSWLDIFTDCIVWGKTYC